MNTIAQSALPLSNRIADTGAAQGLRQHSIGSSFPVIVAARQGEQGLTWEVSLGDITVAGLTNHQAHDLADGIAKIYREHGKVAALETLQDIQTAAL